MLLKSIIKHAITELKIVKNKNDLDNIKGCFIKYLKPAQKYIDEMNPEEMRLFKKGSYGAGGPKGMWLELIKKINKIDTKFEAKEVSNSENTKLLEEIMNRLNDTGETEKLEAKESFFICADKARHTQRKENNDEMTKDIIKTIVAMANGRGGEIIIGVGDPANAAYDEWTYVGLNNTDFNPNTTHDNYQLKVNNKIKQETSEELLQRVTVNAFFSGGENFCIITIKRIPNSKLNSSIFYTMGNQPYYRLNGETNPLTENTRNAHIQDIMTERSTESN